MSDKPPVLAIRTPSEPPRAAEEDQPIRPIDYRDYEPAANMRIRALRLGTRKGWFRYLWPSCDPATTPTSEWTFLVVINQAGDLEEIHASEVLPFVRAIAWTHREAHLINYRPGLK